MLLRLQVIFIETTLILQVTTLIHCLLRTSTTPFMGRKSESIEKNAWGVEPMVDGEVYSDPGLCRSRSCTALKFIPSDSWGLGESKQQTLLGEQFDLLNRKGGVEGQNAVKISGSTLSPQIIDTTPGRLKIQKETKIQKKIRKGN